MTRKKKRFFFNLSGMAVITLWLIMMGLLVKKIHFKDKTYETGGGVVQDVSIDSHQRDWKEIYLKDKKVGYAVSMIKPFDEGYFIQEEIFLKLSLMGQASGIYTITQARVDTKFLLKNFYFSMTSGAVRFDISGKVEGDHLIVKKGKAKGQKTERIELSGTPMIGAGMGPYFRSRKISVGQTFKLPVFDPSTLAQKVVVVKVTAREPVKINRRTFDTFRLEVEMWGKVITFWLDDDGATLKEKGFMGLTAIKSSAANAPRNIEGGGEIDFYEISAVTVDRALFRPRQSSYLKLRINGIDYDTLDIKTWNGGRQRFHKGIMEITRERPPANASYSLPCERYNGKMIPFLEPEFNIESDDREIIDKALQISGDDKDSFSVAKKLLHWVYRNIEKKPVVSIPSALEVLETRVGDCNEHATLLTALLRAMKIPARLSIGLVYSRGKFFYHAWNEAYIGEWISMDATMDQMPVDATHIKLLEGNLDKQAEIVGLIGTLKLEVLDYD